MSNQAKCSPSPWTFIYDKDARYGEGHIISSDGLEIAIVCGSNWGFTPGGPNRDWSGDFDDEEEALANARLLASAPKLHQQLESMCDMWRTVCESYGWDPDHMAQYTRAREALDGDDLPGDKS